MFPPLCASPPAQTTKGDISSFLSVVVFPGIPSRPSGRWTQICWATMSFSYHLGFWCGKRPYMYGPAGDCFSRWRGKLSLDARPHDLRILSFSLSHLPTLPHPLLLLFAPPLLLPTTPFPMSLPIQHRAHYLPTSPPFFPSPPSENASLALDLRTFPAVAGLPFIAMIEDFLR